MRPNVKDFITWCSGALPAPSLVLEIGSYLVPGQEEMANLRSLFPKATYIGCDARKGPGVDLVADALNLPLPNGCCDLVICADTLEHIIHPWRAVEEMKRVVRPEGFVIITSVMDFPIHDYPHDYWRFTQEIFAEFGRYIGNHLVLYQGKPLSPHTVILLASPTSPLPDPPSRAYGFPLVPYRTGDRLPSISQEDPYQELVGELERLRREIAEKDRLITELLNSRSWRMTRPFRKALEYARHLKSLLGRFQHNRL